MLRFLPPSLRGLYDRLIHATPYARGTRVHIKPPEPDPKPHDRERIFRLEIVQDAFCEHRPIASRLFKKPTGHRDREAWCERRGDHHRCAPCEHARTLYTAARSGDWQAECRLHRLATRATVRLLAERGAWREARRRQRADRPADPAPPGLLANLGWARWRARRAAWPEPWFIQARKQAEATLIRAQKRRLAHATQKARARKRDGHACDHAAGLASNSAGPPPAPADTGPSTRVPATPPFQHTGVKIGAGRWFIPFSKHVIARSGATKQPRSRAIDACHAVLKWLPRC